MAKIKYSLVKDQNRLGDLEADFNKINDYLLTFVGDITVSKDRPGQIEISYSEVPFKATLRTDSNLPVLDSASSSQITLTCEKEDGLSVNLIKNVTGNIGYRIFNPQTSAYLVNDPSLLDLTSVHVEPKIAKVFTDYKLTPLFQYQNSLVFFAKDKKGRVHLVNRHLLEYLAPRSPEGEVGPRDDFSVVVAPSIAHFIALFDRGLIPISFYENFYTPTKIKNHSGFNIERLETSVAIETVFFTLDLPSQSFIQLGANRFDFVKKGTKLLSFLRPALKDSAIMGQLMCAKLARDISYIKQEDKLIPKLTLSVFLE